MRFHFSFLIALSLFIASCSGSKPKAATMELPELTFIEINNPMKSAGRLVPVEWSYAVKRISDTQADLFFKAEIRDGWYIYSQSMSDPNGPNPTRFTFTSQNAVPASALASEQGTIKQGVDEVFGINIVKLMAPQAFFVHHLTISDRSTPLTGELEFQTCNDEKCLPPQPLEFMISLKDQ